MDLPRLKKISDALSNFIAHPITNIRAGLKSLFGAIFATGAVAVAGYSALHTFLSTVIWMWVAMIFGIQVINTAKTTIAARSGREIEQINPVEKSIALATYAKDLGITLTYKTAPMLFSTTKAIGEECIFEPVVQTTEFAVSGLYNGIRSLALRMIPFN